MLLDEMIQRSTLGRCNCFCFFGANQFRAADRVKELSIELYNFILQSGASYYTNARGDRVTY